MMCSAGSLFVYNVYARALAQHTVGVSHTTMAFVVLVGNVGLNCGLPAGIAADVYGPRAAIACGALLTGAGYLWLYLALSSTGVTALSDLFPAFLIIGLGSNCAYLPAFFVYKVCGTTSTCIHVHV